MKRAYKLILTCLVLPAACFSQSISQKADELMTAYTKQHLFSGAVLIAKDGKILFEKGYGLANIEKNIPNTPQTEFRIASLTKTFTSTLILQLVEKHQISLDDPLSKFIPDYPHGNEILIKHLLSHTSGIKSYTTMPDYFSTWINEPLSLTQTIDKFKNYPLEFTPGTKMSYSNSNYVLLSYIAEKASGKDLGTLYQDQIIRKLQLKHTGKDGNNRTSPDQALGYQTDMDDPQSGKWKPAMKMNIDIAAGAGCLYSSVEDFYAWDRSFYQNALLSDSMKKLAFTPVKDDYGLGWMISHDFGHLQIGHTGKSPDGFIANIMRYPEDNICIIFLCNYGDLDGRKLTNDLKALVFNQPYQIPQPKKEVKLSTEELKKYVGVYELNENFKLTLSTEDNKLFGIAPGDPQKTELTAEGNHHFYIKGPNVEVEFQEENGAIKYMILKQGGDMKLTKIQ